MAARIKALGAKCEFLSVVGNDESAEILRKNSIKKKFFITISKILQGQTTLKKRYLVENQKLFRVSKLSDHFLMKKLRIN